MTAPQTPAGRAPVYSRRCKERCLGVLYHSGHHQTSDYDAIRREAAAAAIERARRGVNESIEAHNCAPCAVHEYTLAILDAAVQP